MDKIKSIRASLNAKLAFIDPKITFIANAAFAFLVFLLFMLAPQGWGSLQVSILFKYAGGILSFLVLMGAMVAAGLLPLFTKKLCPSINYMLGFFYFMICLLSFNWGVVVILNVLLVILPWMFLTFLKTDEKVGFGN